MMNGQPRHRAFFILPPADWLEIYGDPSMGIAKTEDETLNSLKSRHVQVEKKLVQKIPKERLPQAMPHAQSSSKAVFSLSR